MSDHSLDEFAPASGTDDSESDPETDDSRPTTDDSATASTVDPAVGTATVSPGGTSCENCGETVTRRWHDDGQYLCGDCKKW